MACIGKKLHAVRCRERGWLEGTRAQGCKQANQCKWGRAGGWLSWVTTACRCRCCVSHAGCPAVHKKAAAKALHVHSWRLLGLAGKMSPQAVQPWHEEAHALERMP